MKWVRTFNLNLRGMKRKFILVVAVLTGLLGWQCSRNTNMDTLPLKNTDLKNSLQASVDKVNSAIGEISQTSGYQLLSSQNGSGLKSGESYTDSITMSMLKGVYSYQPDTNPPSCMNCLYKMFSKTGTSDAFVVKLPQKLIFHPQFLHRYDQSNAGLVNNFTITASDYHYYYTNGNLYDYKLSAGFTVDSSNIGSLYIHTHMNNTSGLDFSSKYSFENGYYITASGKSGDTIQNTISLTSDTGTLFSETLTYTGGGNRFRLGRADYSLTIGNMEIRKLASVDSIQVYLNGTLQQKAAVRFIDSTDSTSTDHSVCSSRDIRITFDDGTTTNLSTLISPSVTILNTVIGSMRNMYFATDIMDYIAYNIYMNRM